MRKLLVLIAIIAVLLPTVAIARDKVMCEDWLSTRTVLVEVSGGDAVYHGEQGPERMSTTEAYQRIERLLMFKWECTRARVVDMDPLVIAVRKR